jgi:hypothetical protein
MASQNKVVYRTNYFRRGWTWIKRILTMILLGVSVLFIPMDDEFQFVKIVLICLVVFYYIAKPKDDLAVTDTLLVHIKRSAIKKFTRIDKYEISELSSIRCGGIHSDEWELVDFFNGWGNNGGYYNTVEMTFRNGGSKSLLLPIDRKKLDTIVKIIYDSKSGGVNKSINKC